MGIGIFGGVVVTQYNPDRMEQAFAIVSDACGTGPLSGAVAAVGGVNGIFALRAYGLAVTEPEQISMRAGTLFDLDSLTTVMATTPALLQLMERGRFVLDTPIRQIIPELVDDRVSIRHLLTHTSGLKAWEPLYLNHTDWDGYIAGIVQTDLQFEPGERVEYSDLGYILLGEVIRRTSGLGLREYCLAHVFAPLGLQETDWTPRVPRHRIAATEKGNRTEMERCGLDATSFSGWRKGLIWGEANDGNAFYGLGGVASHGGLFSTVSDIAVYAQSWLIETTPLLSFRTMLLATRNLTPGLGENRGLGWQKPPTAPFPFEPSSCGDLMSPSAFGHASSTGVSLWIDPEQDLFVILLTNRGNLGNSDLIRWLRPAFHNAVVASLR